MGDRHVKSHLHCLCQLRQPANAPVDRQLGRKAVPVASASVPSGDGWAPLPELRLGEAVPLSIPSDGEERRHDQCL